MRTEKYIDGYAFRENQKEIAESYKLTYESVKGIRQDLDIVTEGKYKHSTFSGVLKTDQHTELSDLQLILLASSGWLPFGGTIGRNDMHFWGTINTD